MLLRHLENFLKSIILYYHIRGVSWRTDNNSDWNIVIKNKVEKRLQNYVGLENPANGNV